jgi:hypothetical protein
MVATHAASSKDRQIPSVKVAISFSRPWLDGEMNGMRSPKHMNL